METSATWLLVSGGLLTWRVNLDFDARVPIPFSLFPSSYRSDAVQTTTETRIEGEINLPQAQQRVGREGQYSSSISANLPPQDGQFRQEEVHITREEDRHRPSRREDIYIRDERRPGRSQTNTHIEVDLPRRRRYDTEVDIDIEQRRPRYQDSELDVTERQYRSKFQPSYREEVRTTVDPPRFQPQRQQQPTFTEDIRVGGTTVDPPRFQPTVREEYRATEQTVDPPRFQPTTVREEYRATEETVDPRSNNPPSNTPRSSVKMGYYDEDASGHYHSFRHGLHRAAERIVGGPRHHYDREEIDITIGSGAPRRAASSASSSEPPNTVTIPTHHIRLGDLLILQGRPCQVIRITTSPSTGQHRYLGVDLFTKQLHEESSFISNPSPSVIVQTMLGPVFKQYRVLDLQDGTVVAMTETGDVKQALPVLDQSNLWSRLTEAFESGRGSVRALVINDYGKELVVDMKVIHGSRL
ncbi:hypothetical protein M430DRAFT_47338 [Amorphotheca resinae ATCC 22711]|uniref:Translation elongation factor IF5A C-terminal domain-containing protein n=1 Tax=Amorphotheca resinae ATCC 22711 TaxID=857342 RepID=A0A2T3BG11_AMORE|nr:hypothetical protein M430DRAFT_47338 [Amorphotheca resinae ATCC 22711]PSS28322.1 hypothetical protein M430DRAFT_47338 [Amorphotheca resinae ATCC 22711]